MNVLVWTSWVARPVGGTERIALKLALELRERGHGVVLVGAYENVQELRTQIPQDIPFYHFDIYRRRVKPHISAARLLYRVCKEHHIDVVSAHGNVFAAHEVCRYVDIPLVWTIHGVPERGTRLLERLKTAAVRRVLLSTTTDIVTVSHDSAGKLQRQFPVASQRLHVIYNGAVDEDSLIQLPPPRRASPWRLGFVGRLVEQKRPVDLVAVAQRLSHKLDFRIEVFGDGPEMNALRKAIQQEKLEEKFLLHGYCQEGSSMIFEQVQILLHTSATEGFGLAILEAQLAARPVVAYNVAAVPEIVEHNVTGWLAPLADTAELAHGVQVIADQEFHAFSSAARQRAMKHFKLARMVDQYEALFRNVCASR